MVFGWFRKKSTVELFETMKEFLKIKERILYAPNDVKLNRKFNKCLKESERLLKTLEKEGGEFLEEIVVRLRGTLIGQSEAIKKADWDKLKNFLTKEEELLIFKEPELDLMSEQYTRLAIALNDSGALSYFEKKEIISFFKFSEVLLQLVKGNNIQIIYSIDKSGRILGFLFHSVMSWLGLAKNLKFYFIEGERSGKVTIYSEKQLKELKDKNILVIDEYVQSGDTIKVVCNYLYQYVGKGHVFPVAFSSVKEKMHIYNSVKSGLPSWYGKEKYAGVTEKVQGGVEVLKGDNRDAKNVRKVLYSLAPVIADYLKMKGY